MSTERGSLRGGVAETVPTRLATVPIPRALADAATPLVKLLCHLNTGIKTADAQLVTLATANPVVARLSDLPPVVVPVLMSELSS